MEKLNNIAIEEFSYGTNWNYNSKKFNN
jgi:hypothetical protein